LSGATAFAEDDYARACPLLEEGMALFREQRDKRSLAFWLDYLGQVTQREGNDQHALALYQKLGHMPGMARLLCTRGEMACDKGDYRQAVAHLEEGLALSNITVGSPDSTPTDLPYRI
jgi:tetratricopeptide (TPR) repeat protein